MEAAMDEVVKYRPIRETATGAARTPRVLVVDDSRAHLHLIAQVLSRSGYDVTKAMSGAEALEILSHQDVDIILSDWMMPGMTGLELCRAVRKSEAGEYVYFMLLTSRNGVEDVATGLAAGADDFVSKPIDRGELRARIAAGERLIALQRALVVKNRQLAETLDELQEIHDGLARDLIEARRLQQALVPQRYRQYAGADVSLLLQPSGHIGGDLVGMFSVREHRIGIYSIDVAGHGIASALMTARLASYLSGSSREHNLALMRDGSEGFAMRAPEDVCRILNETILADIETDHYFTMVVAECELTSGQVRLAQAGHPHPLVLRASGAVEFVGSTGMPVGLIPNAGFGTAELVLAPGDRLLLHSDGFIEATDPDGRMLEPEGLSQLVAKHAAARGEAFLDALVWSLSDFTRSRDFADDVSGVLLEYTGLSGE